MDFPSQAIPLFRYMTHKIVNKHNKIEKEITVA